MIASPVLLVDEADPTPPFEQLRRQLADLIASGTLARGERLPSLRQLAGDLDLAVGTVARTYRELEAADLVISRRGGGTRVSGHGPADTSAESRVRLHRLAADFVVHARLLGADESAIKAAVAVTLAAEEPAPRSTARRHAVKVRADPPGQPSKAAE